MKEGVGIRGISRLLNISKTTVQRKILQIAHDIKKPIIATNQRYELDEMCTFLRKKSNQIWIVYAINRIDNSVVDFNIGKRTNKTLRRVVDTLQLSSAIEIYTDKLKNYKYLIDPKIHVVKFKGINHIERMNLTIRTHLKRLSRRTICYSKSLFMLKACLTIYFWS